MFITSHVHCTERVVKRTMSLVLTTLAIILCYLQICEPYKLLVVFPVPGKSHSILGNAFVGHLLNSGHQVTYITPYPMEDRHGLRQINVESNSNHFASEDVLDIQKLMTKEIDMKDMSTVFLLMFNLANATVLHENVQELLDDTSEKFDAVIAEWMYSELYSGFSAVFNCPLIWFLSVSPHSMALSLIDGSTNPAYTADHIQSNSIAPFTFWERVTELRTLLHWQFHRWWVKSRDDKTYNQAFESAVLKRNRKFSPLSETKYTGSLMFVNSHVSTSDAIAIPRSLIEIGGYHINDTVKPLSEDLKAIMDDAKHGVIFFSMGSMLKSAKFPEKIKQGVITVIAQLKQTVIWKFEDSIPEKPKNLFVTKWAPQQSILAHPNCVLFITHGGLLSTTEAVHFGVPIIGIPMFADQFINVNRAVAKGFAKRVDLDNNTPDNLKRAIDEIISNTTYKERVKQLSFIYHDRTISPGNDISRWIHHVIKTGGAPHLRSPAISLQWYQKTYVDLVALIILAVTILSVIKYVIVNRKNITVNLQKKYN